MLRIHLLGHLRCFDADQPRKINGLPRTVPLWGYLLLNRDAPLLRNHIAYILWPDYRESDARANLRRHLHDLRRMLPPAPPSVPWILADATTLQWNPAANYWLDVDEFIRQTDLPEDGMADGAGAGATARSIDTAQVEAGIDLYAGDLLAEYYDDWIFLHREHLRNRFLRALTWLLSTHAAREDFPGAIQAAQNLLHHDAMREDIVRELMRLRAADGDRAGALQEYRRFEQRLRAEMDVPPMPETQALYDALARPSVQPLAESTKRHESGPGRSTSDASAARRQTVPSAIPQQTTPTTTTPSNLPAPVTSFIGRVAELHSLRYQLVKEPSATRLLTLTGPGGCGKTRLALELAQRLHAQSADDQSAPRFPDGIFVVWLATLTEPTQVLRALADVLGLSDQFGQPLAQTLSTFLAAKRMLIILDNFEHLVDAAPDLVLLLHAAPQLVFLVTSRARLRVYGEQEFPVRPLTIPSLDEAQPDHVTRTDAVTLFVARSRAANPSFTLSSINIGDVVAICRRLDGLPLALELAAARTKLLSPAAMLARLDRSLEFLTGHYHPQDNRHRTLRAMLEWSYKLLSTTEQRLFVLLAIFPDSFTVEMAEALGSQVMDVPVLDALETLVDNSLLLHTDAVGDARLHMLSTVHEFAYGRLVESNDFAAAGAVHAQLVAARVAQLTPHLAGAEQDDALHALVAEQINLRSALTWCAAHGAWTLGLGMAAQLTRYWLRATHLHEGLAWLENALAQPTVEPATSAYRHALLAAATLAYHFTDANYAQVRERCQCAADLARAAHDHGLLADTLRLHADTLCQKDPDVAEDLLCEALQLDTELGNAAGQAATYRSLAVVNAVRGRFDQAQQSYQQAVSLYTRLGDRWALSYSHIWFAGYLLHTAHAVDLAQPIYIAGRDLAYATGDTTTYGSALVNLADIALTKHDYAQADILAQEALSVFRSMGELWQPPRLVRMLGYVAVHRGRYDQAAAHFAESLHLNQELGDPRGCAAAIIGLAHILTCRTDRQADTDSVQHAARLLGGVQYLVAQMGQNFLAADQALLEQTLTECRAHLTPADLDAALAQGQTLDLATLIDQATLLMTSAQHPLTL